MGVGGVGGGAIEYWGWMLVVLVRTEMAWEGVELSGGLWGWSEWQKGTGTCMGFCCSWGGGSCCCGGVGGA